MKKLTQFIKIKRPNVLQAVTQSKKFRLKTESFSHKIVFNELERQTILTFNLFLFAATVNILAIAITGGLWIAGKIPEGNYAGLGSGGIIPIVWITSRKAREARDKFLKEAEDNGNRE